MRILLATSFLCMSPWLAPVSYVVAEDAVALAGQDQAADASLSHQETLIRQLGSQSFAQRRSAFIELWRLGTDALPAIQFAKASDNLQIAQAAAALEPILVLAASGSEISAEVYEFVENPDPSRISRLCRMGYWELAEKLLIASPKLHDEFQDAAGTWYANQIAEAALQQGDPALAWPLIRWITSSRPASYDGGDLSVWLAARHDLQLDAENLTSDSKALRLLYQGKAPLGMGLPMTDVLKRRVLTRTGQWSALADPAVQDLFLGQPNNRYGLVARAILFEAAGDIRQSTKLWNQTLDQPGIPADDATPEGSDPAGALPAEELAAYRLLKDAPTSERNRLLLVTLLSGHAQAVAQYLKDTNPLAAFDFYSSNSDYAAAFALVGLEQDLSNFDSWLDSQRLILQAEASRSMVRGGSDLFEQAAHLCNLLVGLGFKDEARKYLEAIAEAADTKSNIWEYSVLIWLSRSEPRRLALEVLEDVLTKLPTEPKRAILASLFPEIEHSVQILLDTAPPLVPPGELQSVGTLLALDHLQQWDHAFFGSYDVSIADWLVRAERELLLQQGPLQPVDVLQLSELADLARGCGYEELALQFSLSDLADNGSEGARYAVPQNQKIIGAEILLDRGEADRAAKLLREVRSSTNANNNPWALILETKALLLAGDFDEALCVDLSRWMRPLSVTRFYRGPYYSKTASELMDRNEITAAREYAELAFQLSDFGSMDFYWAAADLSNILEEQDDFRGSANTLRAPLIEALVPGTSQLDFQASNLHIHFLRNAIKRERIHRAAACILEENYDEAEHHIQVGNRLQPQDIEMVVVCYPKLMQAGRREMAERLFREYETTMLEQIASWPNDAMALNNLAWMYTQCDRKLDDALQLAHRAVSLAPTSAIYLDTLAEVHFRSGRTQAAIATMQDCIRMDPREQHYRDNLARFQTPGS
ncbi:MAG: hypothetical protein NXI32_06815 [bacterium]|nr:hypothetical protein [bacterium]